MKKKCKNCKFWKLYGKYVKGYIINWGLCKFLYDLIILKQKKGDRHKLQTREDFYCIYWKER